MFRSTGELEGVEEQVLHVVYNIWRKRHSNLKAGFVMDANTAGRVESAKV